MLMIAESATFVSNGTTWTNIPANTPIEVPERLVQAALVAGCRPDAGSTKAVVEPEPVDADKSAKLIDAMLDIMATGDSALFTRDGEPRHAAVKERVDFEFTAGEREAAWATVKDVDSE